MDALPPPVAATTPPQDAAYAYAPGDVGPRSARERELCERASHADWLYLAGLVVLDASAIYLDGVGSVQDSPTVPLRFVGPTAVGLTWGATLGGGWLAMPKCDPQWIDSPPREGEVRADWPIALSLALLAGATAPILNGIVVGSPPQDWSTFESSMHIVTAGVAGFAGALLPYVLPPRSWAAARELRRLRVGADAHGAVLSYVLAF